MKKRYSINILWFITTSAFIFADSDPDSVAKIDASIPIVAEHGASDSEKNVTSDRQESTTSMVDPIAQKDNSSEESKKSTFTSYEKKNERSLFSVRTITILLDGKVPGNEDFIRSHIKLTKGDSFDRHFADEAIHSLSATNMFDDVRVSADQNEDGSLDLIFSLTTRPKIATIEFPHAKISNKKLKKSIKTVEGEYLNKAFINDDIQTIYQYYQAQGFPRPTISYQIMPTDDPKYVKVIFDIILGEGFHISKIKFTNFGDVETEKIQKKLILKTWSFFSFLTKKGYFIDILLDADRATVVEEMQNAGYLDAKVISAEFVKGSSGKSGALEFVAELGEKYFAGEIHFEGNKIYPDDKIASLIKIKTGDPFSPGNIAGTAEAIRNFYSYHGYINSYVEIEKVPTFADNRIDVKFTIHESPLTYVNSVLIRGNFKTKNKVILRELALAPGDKFNYVKMKNSENRLKNTEFFETVLLDIEDSDIPDHKNILIDVKEKNTGKIQIGGAISATNNQLVFLELSQSNFDLFNSRAKHQGGGQKARARIQMGTREHQLALSFEEPYLFDRALAFGVDVFGEKTKYRTSDSNYSGPTYDQTSLGFEPYFRKRLYELWVGRLAYNFTHKNIRNVSITAVQPLKDEAGHNSSSRLKFSIERDTRDNYIFPRCGSFIGVETQLAGLGGTTKLFRATTSVAKWITISEKYDHTLSMIAKIGVICPFANQ